MRPAAALYFNDADWLEQTQTGLAHGDLSPDVAKALGCRSLRYHNQVSLKLVLHDAGPKEKLCTSKRKLISCKQCVF